MFQDIDTDYIKETLCTDPVDGREHIISEVELEHMYCINPERITDANSASHHAVATLVGLTILLAAAF